MRAIKFRAWDKKNQTMWINVQNAYDTIHHHAEDNSKGLDVRLYADCFQEVLDDPQMVVMQFTDLLDKNGKEIYEGDIVEHRGTGASDYSRGVVSIEPTRGVIVGTWPIGFDPLVIGNIHENPELLK